MKILKENSIKIWWLKKGCVILQPVFERRKIAKGKRLKELILLSPV
jgi:hypothetical protein